MSNGEWLTWILADEKKAREAERQQAEAKRQHQGWAYVEE